MMSAPSTSFRHTPTTNDFWDLSYTFSIHTSTYLDIWSCTARDLNWPIGAQRHQCGIQRPIRPTGDVFQCPARHRVAQSLHVVHYDRASFQYNGIHQITRAKLSLLELSLLMTGPKVTGQGSNVGSRWQRFDSVLWCAKRPLAVWQANFMHRARDLAYRSAAPSVSVWDPAPDFVRLETSFSVRRATE
jgi:hypothetical protein